MATTGDNATHDPSSSDGLAWKAAGLRITLPSWVGDYLTGDNQGVWAPDIRRRKLGRRP